MSDSRAIIIHGDLAIFEPIFGNAIALQIPVGDIQGSGHPSFGGNLVCVEGDEQTVEVDVPYMAPPFIGGQGKVKIEELECEQIASHTTSRGQPVILKGKKFKAILEVTSPAKDPNGLSDPNKTYSGGKGEFQTTNKKFTGT